MSGYKSHGPRPDSGGSSSTGPLVVRGPSSEEASPLLPGRSRPAISRDGCKAITYSLAGLLVFFFISANLILHIFFCPLFPSTMNAIRRDWEIDVAQHDILLEKWRLEKLGHDTIEEEWKLETEWHEKDERKKHEDEERQKLNMFWGGIEAHTCTTYATRDYTAQLMNLPTTWEHRVEACKATPLEVHGVSYLPKSCEDKASDGCTSPSSGKRRIEHYLENLPRGSDWREFCATTPAHFLGMEFSGAQECFQYNLGTYGHWEIDDTSCQ
ncbi:hypothetical protein EV363DRAFT_1434818 [Boletus edulis]|nr:hypothetical protein EV363DRAFT_1434818 [Boletus edulis]